VLGWLIRYALSILVLLPWFVRVFPNVLPRFPLGRILLCGLAMAALLWVFADIKMPAALSVGLGGAAGMAVYVVALLVFRVRERLGTGAGVSVEQRRGPEL